MDNKKLDGMKDDIAQIVVEHCNAESFETVISIAEDVMTSLDKILFSEDFENITEAEVNAELATLIVDNIQKRRLAIVELGDGG